MNLYPVLTPACSTCVYRHRITALLISVSFCRRFYHAAAIFTLLAVLPHTTPGLVDDTLPLTYSILPPLPRMRFPDLPAILPFYLYHLPPPTPANNSHLPFRSFFTTFPHRSCGSPVCVLFYALPATCYVLLQNTAASTIPACHEPILNHTAGACLPALLLPCKHHCCLHCARDWTCHIWVGFQAFLLNMDLPPHHHHAAYARTASPACLPCLPTACHANIYSLFAFLSCTYSFSFLHCWFCRSSTMGLPLHTYLFASMPFLHTSTCCLPVPASLLSFVLTTALWCAG